MGAWPVGVWHRCLQFKKADAATILSTAAALTTNPGQGAGGALAGAPPAAQQSMLTGLMLAGYQLLGELVRELDS